MKAGNQLAVEEKITVRVAHKRTRRTYFLHDKSFKGCHDRGEKGSAEMIGEIVICTTDAKVGCIAKPFGTVGEENGVDRRH